MLHLLEPPLQATRILRWVVDLQERLMRGLCDSQTTSDTVTVAWVQRLWPDAPVAWVEKFCGRKGLQLMRQLGGAPSEEKAAVLQGFLNDVGCLRSFEPGLQGLRFQGLACCGENETLREATKDLFGMFYSPRFDPGEGYPQAGQDGTTIPLDRRAFVEEFLRDNFDLAVCPYCDGTCDPNVTEVDHYYPKAAYPFLVMVPENLIPVCPRCNDLRIKGSTAPLDPGAVDETANWFHPYYRSAAHQFAIAFLPPRAADQPRSLALVGPHPVTQRRLDNLDRLLDITRFWADRLKHRMNAKMVKLRTKRRKRGRPFTSGELRAQFDEWADEAHDGKRREEFALLREAFCRAVAEGDTQFLDEFTAINDEPI